jgi:hypothetical protein
MTIITSHIIAYSTYKYIKRKNAMNNCYYFVKKLEKIIDLYEYYV